MDSYCKNQKEKEQEGTSLSSQNEDSSKASDSKYIESFFVSYCVEIIVEIAKKSLGKNNLKPFNFENRQNTLFPFLERFSHFKIVFFSHLQTVYFLTFFRTIDTYYKFWKRAPAVKTSNDTKKYYQLTPFKKAKIQVN